MRIHLSLIVPVYNRPQEVKELLESLCEQTDAQFEVVIVEDGSVEKCDDILEHFRNKLDLHYFYKANSGPGLSRNYGAKKARGDFYIFLDSDCIIPKHYISAVKEGIVRYKVDTFGGPDRAHQSFTVIQKAINYSMTSLFTTGGIRGGKARMEKFHPRSFNMGMSKEAFAQTGGFSAMRFGEDIDLSIRIFKKGFTSRLFPKAFVYHKRRTNFRQFFKQVFNSGIARINLYRRHPHTLKAVHFFPALFTLGLLLSLVLLIWNFPWTLALYGLYFLVIFFHSSLQNRSAGVGGVSIVSSFVQLTSYGLGFILSFYQRIILGKDEFARFTRNFYK